MRWDKATKLAVLGGLLLSLLGGESAWAADINPLCPALQALSNYYPFLKIVFVGGLALIVLITAVVAVTTEKYRHAAVAGIVGSVFVIALWYVANAIEPKVKEAAENCEMGYTKLEWTKT